MKRFVGKVLLLAATCFLGQALYAEEVITEAGSPVSVMKPATMEAPVKMEEAKAEEIKAEEGVKTTEASEMPVFENQTACSAPATYHTAAYTANDYSGEASAPAMNGSTCCETTPVCAPAPCCNPCWRPLWRPCCWQPCCWRPLWRPCCWRPCFVPMCNPAAPAPMTGCGCY